MTWESKFVTLIGKERCKQLIKELADREVSFRKELTFPIVPLWHPMLLLSGRSNDPRIEGRYFHTDESPCRWYGLERAEREFFVRNNNGHMEFAAILTNPQKPGMYYSYKPGGKIEHKADLFDVKVIGTNMELLIKKYQYPDRRYSETSLDDLNCFDRGKKHTIAHYCASQDELLKAIAVAFGKGLTQSELVLLEEENGFTKESYSYRPDIWEQ